MSRKPSWDVKAWRDRTTVCKVGRLQIASHRDVVGIVGAVTDRPVVGSLRQSCLAEALSVTFAVLGTLERRRYPIKIAKPQCWINLAQAGYCRPRFDQPIRKNIGNRRHPQCRGQVWLLVEGLGRAG